MADDTILEIGALVDLSQFTPGMETMAATTASTTASMTTSFANVGLATQTSTSQVVSALETIPATLSAVDATVAKTSVTVEAETHSMGAFFLELGTTVKEVVASIFGSLTGLDERIAQSAERAGVETGAMRGAFAGLSSFLGAGIAVGFAAHFLDEVAKMQVELGHLSASTGIAVTTLAGLRAAAQQAGGSFESFEGALIRMQRAQILALEGHQQQITAFHRIGIELRELSSLNPEELFNRLSTAIADSTSTQNAATSAIAAFGRGGYVLIPILKEISERAKEAGVSTQEYVHQLGLASGVTDESVATSQKWAQMTAQLAQQMQSLLIPAIGFVIHAIEGWKSAFVLVRAGFDILALEIGTTLRDLAIEADATGKEIVAALTPGAEVGEAWAAALQAVDVSNQITADQVKAIWAKALADVKNIIKEPPKLPPPTSEPPPPVAGKSDVLAAEAKDLLEIQLSSLKAYEAQARSSYEFVAATSLVNSAERQAAEREWQGVQAAMNNAAIVSNEAYFTKLKAIFADDPKKLEAAKAEELKYSNDLLAKSADGLAGEYAKLTTTHQAYLEDLRKSVEDDKNVDEGLKRISKSTLDYVKSLETLGAVQAAGKERDFSAEEAGIKNAAANELITEREKIAELKALYQDQLASRLTTLNEQLERQQSMLAAAQAEETAAETAHDAALLSEKKAAYNNQLAAYLQTQQQIQAVNQQFATQQSALLAESQKQWLRFGQQISSDFSNAVGQMIRGQASFGQAMAQLGANIVVQFAQYLAQMLAMFVVHEAMKTAAVTAGQSAQTAATIAGQAAQTAAENQGVLARIIRTLFGVTAHHTAEAQKAAVTATTETAQTAAVTTGQAAQTAAVTTAQAAQTAAILAAKSVQSSAIDASAVANIVLNAIQAQSDIGLSAAIVFLQAIQNIPFPANIAAAPLLAAQTYAFGSPYVALASAKEGALLDADTIVQVHAGELIVPAQHVPSVINAVAFVGGPSLGGTTASVGDSASKYLQSLPRDERSLPTAIRNQFESVDSTTASFLAGSIPQEQQAIPHTMRNNLHTTNSGTFSAAASNFNAEVATSRLWPGSDANFSGVGSRFTSTIPPAQAGALLGEDTVVQAHAGELILPVPLSLGLQQLITSSAGTFSESEKASAAETSTLSAGRESEQRAASAADSSGRGSVTDSFSDALERTLTPGTSAATDDRLLSRGIRSQFDRMFGPLTSAMNAGGVVSAIGSATNSFLESLPREDRTLQRNVRSQFERMSTAVATGGAGANMATSIAAKALGVKEPEVQRVLGGGELEGGATFAAPAATFAAPAALTTTLDRSTNIINNSTINNSPSRADAVTGGGGTFHYHDHRSVNALDGRSVAEAFHSNRGELAKVVGGLVRSGHISARSLL